MQSSSNIVPLITEQELFLNRWFCATYSLKIVFFPVSLPVVQSAHLWQERQEWSTNGQHSCHNSRCIHWNRQILKLDWTWLQVPIGVKYFGGGPVERVPFFWYNLCFTVAYIQGVGAVRYMNTNEKMRPRSKYDLVAQRKIYVNGELNFNLTTKFLNEVLVNIWGYF